MKELKKYGKRSFLILKKFELKKVTAVILAASMMLGLSGCGKKKEKETTESVVTTEATTATEEPTEEVHSGEATLDRSFVDMKFASKDNEEFNKFLDDYFKEAVTADTLSYNYLVKDGSKFGVEPPVATVGDADLSVEAFAEAKEHNQKKLDELHKFKDAKLTETQYIDYLWLESNLEDDVYTYEHRNFYEPFSYMRGFQGNIGTNLTHYRFDDKKDVEDYITILGQIPGYVQAMIDFENEKAASGYMMSDENIDAVIEQCDEFLANEGAEHFLITCFNDNIDKLDFLTDAEKEDYKKKDAEAVKKYILPTFHNIKDSMAKLKGTGKNNTGLYGYGDEGVEYYKHLLKVYTGSEKTPEEMIKTLETRQKKAVSAMGVIVTVKPDAYTYFADNYATLFDAEKEKEPREMIDDLMNNYMAQYPRMNKINYDVAYLPKSLEEVMGSTLAYYMSPAIDDQEHNIIRVNGKNTDTLWNTLAHEGCPGHMYQNAYYMSTNPHPVRSLGNELGYMEGWAVYSSYEAMYLYDFGGSEYKKELGKLSVFNESLGYLVYGRIDLGVNYEGWTVDDVANYMTTSGFGSDGAAEIFKIVKGDPAVYLSYSMGYYEMLEQREKAEDYLGDKFDPIAFHKVVLDAGPVKYDILSKVVDKYIIEKQ